MSIDQQQHSFVHPQLELLGFEKIGLNLQGVLSLGTLSEALHHQLHNAMQAGIDGYSQLILLGHGGSDFWKVVKGRWGEQFDARIDPLDDFVTGQVNDAMNASNRVRRFRLLYPDCPGAVDLPALGRLLGWHDDTPFALGINERWGSWFAYRALVIADSDFDLSPLKASPQICSNCQARECINACPAQALNGGKLNLQVCLDYRRRQDSRCRETCVARCACPVKKSERYSREQIKYHYGQSLQMLLKTES